MSGSPATSTPLKIGVIDDYSDGFRKASTYGQLAPHQATVFSDTIKDPAQLAARLQGFNALVLTQQRSRITRDLLARLPQLKLISQTGNHTAHIDLPACTEHGIAVCAAGGGRSHATAELTWGLIFALLRKIPYEVERLKSGHWLSTIGVTVRGKTLGIYAFGNIGSLVADAGRAFGMKVICWGREGSLARAREKGYAIAASREAFFAESDIVSLHIPLNDTTRGIVTAADLARMKPSAVLVNTSRAPLIATGALEDALTKGRPGFGAIDVYEEEPVLGANHPLLKMPNVLCTPHLGYVVESSLESFYTTAIENLLAFGRGQPVNVKNPEALAKR